MARYPQPDGAKGSLKWIQRWVNEAPSELNAMIHTASDGRISEEIDWRSPLNTDEHAEYRDAAFLELLGLQLPERPLDQFWPSRGPQWDALGLTASGQAILVEAKANIPEIVSPATGAGAASKRLIDSALEETARFLGVSSTCDWSGTFYQYTNRLAHLYLLREVNRIDAWLVFLYFVGDTAVAGPKSPSEWKAALQVMHGALGLRKRHRLHAHVVDVFLDVSERD